MFDFFDKAQPKVVVGEQLCEVVSMHVKVRTPVGEFLIDQPIRGHVVLRPGDSLDLTWKWNGFTTGFTSNT